MSGSIGSNQEPKDMEQDVDSNGCRSEDENEHAAEPESQQENEESIGNAAVSMEEGLQEHMIESDFENHQSSNNPREILPDLKAPAAGRILPLEIDGPLHTDNEFHNFQLPRYKDQVFSQSEQVDYPGLPDQGDFFTQEGSTNSSRVASILGTVDVSIPQSQTYFVYLQGEHVIGPASENGQEVTVHNGEAYLYTPAMGKIANRTKYARHVIVAFLLFVLFGFLPIYCGSGNCVRNSNDLLLQREISRAKAIAEYINEITLSSKQIAYPPLFGRETAEDFALQWLIKTDPMHLSADSATGRFHLKQRYALLTLWFQPYEILHDLDWLSMGNETECSWNGVSCKPLNIKDSGVQLAVARISLGGRGCYYDYDSFYGYSNETYDTFNYTEPPTNFTEPPLDDIFQSPETVIPSDIGLLNTLEELDLSGSSFGGVIPAAIGLLSKLTLLDLHCNSLRGNFPSFLSNLSNLQHLSLGQNSIQGAIPDSILTLTKLTWLDLESIGYSEKLPSSWEKLSQLQVLNLSSSAWSSPIVNIGTIPDSIWSLSHLKQLKLSGRKNPGKIPSTIGKTMKSLVILDLSDSNIFGTIPDSIGLLSNLTHLSLLQTALTGTLPAIIFDVMTLETLQVSSIRLNGTITESLFSKWPKMKNLVLSGMELTGTLPASIGNMNSIKYLDFSSNQFHGTIPASISNWIHISVLDLSNNTLSGLLPSSLEKMVSLNSLSLSHNNLQGTIPSFYSKWKNLYHIDLSCNIFSGELPEVIGLGSLNFSHNNLAGTFPHLTQQSQFLYALDLSNNNLSGTLPPSIGRMSQLLFFNVSNNKFSGTIPESIFHIDYIYEADSSMFDFSNNNFTGAVPDIFCNGQDRQLSGILKVDCDEVYCSCCSDC